MRVRRRYLPHGREHSANVSRMRSLSKLLMPKFKSLSLTEFRTLNSTKYNGKQARPRKLLCCFDTSHLDIHRGTGPQSPHSPHGSATLKESTLYNHVAASCNRSSSSNLRPIFFYVDETLLHCNSRLVVKGSFPRHWLANYILEIHQIRAANLP